MRLTQKILIPLVLAIAFVGGSNNGSVAAAFDYSYGSVQGWEIGWDDTSKACMVYGGFEAGTDLIMSLESPDEGFMLFANRSWGFVEKGKSYHITYEFDGNRSSWSGSMTGIVLSNSFGLVSTVPAEFLEEIARFKNLRIFVGKDRKRFLGGLSLRGTRAALNASIDCTRKMPRREEVAGQNDSQQVATRSEPERDDESGPSSGTGIIVSRSGHVLTNHHVIKGCTSISVTQIGNTPKPAEIIRSDENNDLAILKTDETYQKVAIFRVGTSVKPGESVAVYGYPLAGALSLSGNIVSGNVTSLSGLGDDVRFLQISAPIQPGNSGGPLLDDSGLLIGVVSSKLNEVAALEQTGSLPQNVNFAVRGSVARNFLEAHAIPFETSLDASSRQLTEVAEEAREFAVRITCP